jgi:hypothetical protein
MTIMAIRNISGVGMSIFIDNKENQVVKEYESKVDANRRITLRKVESVTMFEHFKTIHLEDGSILLRPLVLVPPEQAIGAGTLSMIHESVSNSKKSKIGGAFKKDDFKGLLTKTKGE